METQVNVAIGNMQDKIEIGRQPVSAIVYGLLAVTPTIDEFEGFDKPSWVVTHIGTGRQAIPLYFYEQDYAMMVAEQLDTMIDWDKLWELYHNDPIEFREQFWQVRFYVRHIPIDKYFMGESTDAK